jgi:hypothetical protein
VGEKTHRNTSALVRQNEMKRVSKKKKRKQTGKRSPFAYIIRRQGNRVVQNFICKNNKCTITVLV